MVEGKTKMRLQKYLSQAGLASRREAEQWIRDKRVSVQREEQSRPELAQVGESVDPGKDQVFVDGKKVQGAEKHVYYLFHKPKNVMVTRKDPEGRPTVFDYLKDISERVNYVGRLDFDSEGLIFLTNDGALHHRWTHPKSKVEKKYRVKVGIRKTPADKLVPLLSSGVNIGDYTTAPCKVRIVNKDPGGFWIEMILTEGKQRQIRKMLEAVGCKVIRLVRIAIGPLELGDLAPGRYRALSRQEVE